MQKRLKLFAITALGFLALNIAGYILEKSLPEYDAKIRVGIVQANIGNLEKQQAEKGPMFRDHIFRTYSRLSTELINKSKNLDFIVWPETAFPSTVYPDGEGDFYVEALKKFVLETKTSLVTGGYGYNIKLNRYTNSMFIVENGEFHSEQYIKTHLLAFGEFVPLADRFPVLKKWVPAGDFLPGQGPKVLKLGELNIGPQICYEGLYPLFSRELAQNKAHLILNITNDSWFGVWQEPFQHLIMTLARGIELRLPVIRSTNTGISTVSLADGTILQKTPLHKEAIEAYEIPLYKDKKSTFFQLFPWLMDLIFVFLLALIIWRSYIERTQKT